jgi:thioredoxin
MAIVVCPNCGTKNRVDESAAAQKQPVCGRCGAKLTVASNDHPVELTDASFDRFLAEAGDKPVLVDCWAAWCGPCRMLAPTIDVLAKESAGRWIVAKLDTDANQRTAARFRISGIPTMLIFKQGELVDQLVGLQPKRNIEARLAKISA